jgi:hypothetical protein
VTISAGSIEFSIDNVHWLMPLALRYRNTWLVRNTYPATDLSSVIAIGPDDWEFSSLSSKPSGPKTAMGALQAKRAQGSYIFALVRSFFNYRLAAGSVAVLILDEKQSDYATSID